MRKTDMSNASYKPAKGSARVGSKGAPKQPGKTQKSTSIQGFMDSRPSNSDRNQSAK